MPPLRPPEVGVPQVRPVPDLPAGDGPCWGDPRRDEGQLVRGDESSIENKSGTMFPFSVGQILNRNIEVWASNNNFLMDGKDTGPEKKIFGVKISDVPKGHEWRHIYPNKFR